LNLVKILTPDFFVGKTLVTAKALLDTAWLIARRPSRESFSFAWLVLRVKPKFTMVKTENLKTLYDLARESTKLRLTGDIVECGVWNGGSAAVMGVACMEAAENLKRDIWLFDSFQGLPPPGEQDGEWEKRSYFQGWNRGDVKLVREVFNKVGLPCEKVRITPGWFSETLQTAPIKEIVLLHIDADWYNSVKTVLETFFDRVVPGGFVVLDDYGYWQGCSQALTDFFAERGIHNVAIKKIGRQGAYFRKPYEAALSRRES
jgi:O-methyltransferase